MSRGAAATPLMSEAPQDRAGAETEEPVKAHAVMIAVFSTALAVGLGTIQRRHLLPNRLSLHDLALLGVATHKLSRIVALDRISSPLRAPFTAGEEPTGAGEVEADPRGRGFQRALGQLLTCPYCLAPWIAGSFLMALLYAPRQTRYLASLLNVVALSDFLNQRYAHLKELNR